MKRTARALKRWRHFAEALQDTPTDDVTARREEPGISWFLCEPTIQVLNLLTELVRSPACTLAGLLWVVLQSLQNGAEARCWMSFRTDCGPRWKGSTGRFEMKRGHNRRPRR